MPRFFPKIYFFSRPLKTRKGCRYQDSVRDSEFATSSPSILKMCKKWIGATGEPGYCVKVGWKRVKKRVRVKFLLLLLNKIVVLTFDRKWIHHQKWVQIKCCQYSSISPPSCGVPLRPLVSFFFCHFFVRQHKIDCGDIWQKITKCRK